MKLQEAICGNLRLHSELVQAGMNSTEALNLIMAPLETKNLKESLERLTVGQLDNLVLLLRNNLYHVSGKKSAYKVAGIVPYKGELHVVLTDAILEIDNIYPDLLELPQQLTEDILKTIRQIL